MAAFETGSSESHAATSMMYIEGMIVSDSPTKRKRRKAAKKIVSVVRDITRCFCSGRGISSPQMFRVDTIARLQRNWTGGEQSRRREWTQSYGM